MTDKPSLPTDENSLPLEQSRRTLLRLLGSATAVGTMSGVAAAGGDDHEDDDDHDHDHDEYCECERKEHEKKEKITDALHFDGIELKKHEFHAEKMAAAPTVDGHTYEVFACHGVKAKIKNDHLEDMSVDKVKMDDHVEEKVTWLLEELADGDMPDELEDMPDALEEYLLDVDENYYKHILNGCDEHNGPADALESRLNGLDGALPALLLFEALLLIILTVVVIFFVILSFEA